MVYWSPGEDKSPIRLENAFRGHCFDEGSSHSLRDIGMLSRARKEFGATVD